MATIFKTAAIFMNLPILRQIVLINSTLKYKADYIHRENKLFFKSRASRTRPGGESVTRGFCDSSQSKNDSTSNLYDQRKYGHNLPKSDVNVFFDSLPNIPSGIFRKVDGEVLGLGAGKCCVYKNPEYFSFHHMTYYDMHVILRCFRQPSPKTGRKF